MICLVKSVAVVLISKKEERTKNIINFIKTLGLSFLLMNILIVSAYPASVGKEFQINTQNVNSQYIPRLESLSGGGFVAVWFPELSTTEARGQIFDSAGNKVGSEFQVIVDTAANDYHTPAVTRLPGGGFVVIYHSVGIPDWTEKIYIYLQFPFY